MKTITTNKMAHQLGQQFQLDRTAYAIEAQIAAIKDRIKTTSNEDIKLAWTVAIIELQELAKTLGATK